MEKFVKGDIVVIPFPFSDLSSSKKRPALVIANPYGDDILLCQITSRSRSNNFSIQLRRSNFSSGVLPVVSFAKVNRLFSADSKIIDYKIGSLNYSKKEEIEAKLIEFIQR